MQNYDNDQILLEGQDLQVGISPSVGASIFCFKYKLNNQWVDLMRPSGECA